MAKCGTCGKPCPEGVIRFPDKAAFSAFIKERIARQSMKGWRRVTADGNPISRSAEGRGSLRSTLLPGVNVYYDTHRRHPMGRTNVVLDDRLVEEAKKLAGEKTARETIDLALREFVARRKRRDILAWEGKLRWEGDLDRIRRPR
jgi:Arc/MetJ family transcription regulator